jgi:hypothetical protein
MRWMKVHWRHDIADEPFEMLYELDDSHWCTRILEFWRDGRIGWATKDEEHGGTHLPEKRMADPVSEISKNPEFDAVEILREEFEDRWLMRTE